MAAEAGNIVVRRLPGLSPYQPVWQAMQAFTNGRTPDTPDEIWLVEHEPVYTLGLAGKPEHVLDAGGIPLVKTDRGGQVTYHGPGQAVLYGLVDLRRYGLYVKDYVELLEDTALAVLAELGLPEACRKPGAPGVYVPTARAGLAPVPGQPLAKIAALGVKIRRGGTYHGLSLNVAMNLAPFQGINPCGYAGMPTTDLHSCHIQASVGQVATRLADYLAQALNARRPIP